MPTVSQSSYRIGPAQADGRQTVTETHLISDGRDFQFEYLAGPEINPDNVLALRAARINAELAAREAEQIEAASGEIPLTKFQFRQRFTAAERAAIDAFNAAFESHPVLTTEQKAAIRTALKDLEASQAVYLSNPQTQAGVQMYEALGLLAAGRAAEILSNG